MRGKRTFAPWLGPVDVWKGQRRQQAALASAARQAKLAPEERARLASRASRAYWDGVPAGDRVLISRARAVVRWQRVTPEDRARFGAKLSKAAKARERALPASVRSERARVASRARWAAARAAREVACPGS